MGRESSMSVIYDSHDIAAFRQAILGKLLRREGCPFVQAAPTDGETEPLSRLHVDAQLYSCALRA